MEENEFCSSHKPKPNLSVIEELNLYFNSKIAKVFATGLVLCFVLYHGFLRAFDGGDSCQRLLSDGRFQGALVWQPYGCMLHTYEDTDSRRCMRYVAYLKQNNHIVFLGDSRIRQLYFAMIKQFSDKAIDQTKLKAHSDLHYNDSNLLLNVDFLWKPDLDETVVKQLSQWKRSKKVPKLLVLGGGAHFIKNSNGSEEALEKFKQNLTTISSYLNHIGNRTRVLWMLQDPVVPEKLSPDKVVITNDQIDLYNKAAMEVLYGTNVNIWSSSRLVAQGSISSFTDGLHAGSVTVKYYNQILMNLYCNDHLNFNDGTCCNTREGFTITQITTFAALCTCSVIMIGFAVKQWICTTQSPQHFNLSTQHSDHSSCSSSHAPLLGELPSSTNHSTSDLFTNHTPNGAQVKIESQPSPQKVFMALGKLGLIMAYFFLCDRTSLFMKENKYFSQLNFWLPLGYVFALGLFFTEDTNQTKVLHRDMTDEWKGWMQLVILIYHMTGASKVLPIYMHVRVLVSGYLFLTGYGHFSYYWTGRDMGIVRYCQVMFRLNFLTVLLCLIMNRPYQFYYFVPLVSFWYTVLHVTLVLPPRIQRAHSNTEPSPFNYFYSIIKFIVLSGFITVLFLSEVFFEKIFVIRPWKALFVTTDDDIHEWWFRWQLDRYSILYGMIFGLIYIGLTQYNLINDKSVSNLLLGGRLALLVSFVATVFLVSYSTMTYFCTSKLDCNEVHPYVVWVPILGYILLRNILGVLRTRYSSFFAWFGRISLELFVCQYHIWLAADTHGVLVLIPSYPVANVLATSFIFLCVAHEISHITSVLTHVVVPNDSMKAMRNIALFIMLLFAIAVHDGIF